MSIGFARRPSRRHPRLIVRGLLLVLLCLLASPAWATQNLLDSDGFDGVDGTTLTAYNANWILQASATQNACRIRGTTAVGGALCANNRTGQTWTNDQWAELKAVTNIAKSFFVCVRLATTDVMSGYCGGAGSAEFDGVHYFVRRWDNNVATNIATTAITYALNDVVNLQAVGTTITLNVNGVDIATATDATYATGRPGLMLDEVGAVVIGDTWRAGSVGASGGAATATPSANRRPARRYGR